MVTLICEALRTMWEVSSPNQTICQDKSAMTNHRMNHCKSRQAYKRNLTDMPLKVQNQTTMARGTLQETD